MFPHLDVSPAIMRLVLLITLFATAYLCEGEAEAANLQIRAMDSNGARVISVEPTPPSPILAIGQSQAAAAPAPVNATEQDVLVEHLLAEGMEDELRVWLMQQQDVDNKIFEPLAVADPFDQLKAPDPFDVDALGQPVAMASTAAATPAPKMPVIRAVLADPIPMFRGVGPGAQQAPSAVRRSASSCMWPVPCSPWSYTMGRLTPSERSKQYARDTRLNHSSFAGEIQAVATLLGLDPMFIRAVMHAESSFNPKARSHAGAQGLMQLMPATAKRFGVTDAYEARQNIWGGSRYLAWLLERFNGNMAHVAAAYNAGEGAVDRHGGIPPYRETTDYVEKVLTLWHRYRTEAGLGT